MTDQSINEQVARKLYPDGRFSNKPGIDAPDYSHSIEAAWETVEFAESKGFLFQIDSHQDKEHDLWTVEFLNQDIEIEADESADTAPMAICKAFLKLPEDGK